MKFLNLKGVFYALITLSCTLFAQPYVINNDKILNEQVSLKLEQIGLELEEKTGIRLILGAYENLDNINQTFENLNLKSPYVFLMLEKMHKNIEIFADNDSLKLFDKEQVLSPFPESGTILPILVESKGKDVYNAALLNGYADIAEQIARSKGIVLESGLGNTNKNMINFFRILFYASIVFVVGYLIFKRKVKNG